MYSTHVPGLRSDRAQKSILTICVLWIYVFSYGQSVPWVELGPDNMGGRTRAILFDNEDATHQHMLAGGVSGGLFESFNAGAAWQRCAGWFSQPDVFNSVNCIAQAVNGDIYVGTGEGDFYGYYGIGDAGFLGGGIFKSTDNGLTWNVLSSTQPTQNNPGVPWVSVNKIACDPINPNIVYVAMNSGPRVSYDAGTTWNIPGGVPVSCYCTDVSVGSDRHGLFVVNNKPWIFSDTGMSLIYVGNAAHGMSNNSFGAAVVTIAPSDPSFAYCVAISTNGHLEAMYASLDGGNNWTLFCGPATVFFDPYNSNGSGFGNFANVITVDPLNKHRIIIGGVELWSWEMLDEVNVTGQFAHIANEYETAFNYGYVAEDKHVVLFRPGFPSTFYIGTDRGIFRTDDNGSSYYPVNLGFNTVQCYSVGFDHSSNSRNHVLLGTQDQGFQIIDGSGNTPMSSHKLFIEANGNGCARSFLQQNIVFISMQHGVIFKSINNGLTLQSAYSSYINNNFPFGNIALASFITPLDLWESTNDTLTHDSISFVNAEHSYMITVGNGTQTNYTGTLSGGYPAANPPGTIDLATVKFIAGPDTVFSDAAGNLSGAGTGTVSSNGNYSVNFNSPPSNMLGIYTRYSLDYAAGSTLSIMSKVTGKLIDYTLTNSLYPDDTLHVQDVIQSHLATGFSTNYGVWITRRALDFANNSQWYQVGSPLSQPSPYSGTASVVKWTPDGDHLFVGTENGSVYRFDNLAAIKDSITGNVEIGSAVNPSCIVRCTLIGNFPGRYVKDIDVDPNNAENVVVVLGNYQNTTYVFYSSDAISATGSAGTFSNRTGNLGSLNARPVFTASFDIYNTGRVLIGTEHGVFETGDITLSNPTWVDYNFGFDAVPVTMIRQQRRAPWEVTNSGCFYMASHGRGVWRDDNSWQPMTGIAEEQIPAHNASGTNSIALKTYPVPAAANFNVEFDLFQKGNVIIEVSDAEGNICMTKEMEVMAPGKKNVSLDCINVPNGVYLVRVTQEGRLIGYSKVVHISE